MTSRAALRCVFVAGCIAAGPAGGGISAQLPADVAGELDKLLVQVAQAPAGNPVERARRLEQLGDLELRLNLLGAARAAFDEAAALRSQGAPDDRELGRIALKQAAVARRDKRPADAERFMTQALTRLRTASPASPEYVDALMESARNDPAKAQQYFNEALTIVSKIEPGSAREAQLNESVGDDAVRRRDLEGADRFYSRSLAALQKSPQSVDYARVANALAVVAAARNQPDRARELYESALAIYDKTRPGSLEVAQLLNNLGILYLNRGDAKAAEGMFRRALPMQTAQKAPPDQLGTTQANLALALLGAGRLDEAAAALKVAIDARRGQASKLELATLLTQLARTDRLRGRTDNLAMAREALDIRRAEAPNTLLFAASAIELGLAHERAKAYPAALALYKEAVAIREKLAPNTPELAEALERLAMMIAQGADPLAARNTFERAIDAWGRTAPRSLDHINAIHELGKFLIERGQGDEGLRRLRESVEILERAEAPTGSIDARAELVPRLQAYYGVPMRLLADRGDAGEAFALVDRMHESMRRARCSDCAKSALSPFDALKTVLDAGTAVVAFSVQPDAIYVFLAQRDTPLRVHRIDESRERLVEQVNRFAKRVQSVSVVAADWTPIVNEGLALNKLLFGPIEPSLGRVSSLLILPDGPLEALPFAALVRFGGPSRWQYLMEWKPIAFAPSAMTAARWLAATAAAASSTIDVMPSAVGLDSASVGQSVPGGRLLNMWPTPDAAADAELFRLFEQQSATEPTRAAALAAAQRTTRYRPGRTHPAYWAGYRYYGRPSTR